MDLIASMGKGTQEVERMGVIREIKSELEYSSLFSFSDSNVPYYAIYFPIFDLNSQLYGQQIGMCVLIMKPDKFMGILEGAQATEHTQIYLLDRNDRVLAAQGSPDMEKIGKGWKESSSEYQAASLGLPMGGWQIVSRIPTRELYGGEDGLVGFHTGAYLLALCLMFLMVAFCYWRLLVPIREMDCFVKHVASEPRDRISVRREDEIGRVENSLNQMLDSIEEKNMLIQDARERTYQMEAAEKQLQISAYRNQINPHFLFNSLNVLVSLINKNQETAVRYTKRLSTVYRYVLTQDVQDTVTVKEETEFIENYISILKIRFDKGLEFKFDIESDDMLKFIPPMSLQLLIENAVKHNAVLPHDPLVIRIFSDGSDLYVSNNLIPRISCSEGTGIGLKNLSKKYAILAETDIAILRNKDTFTVKLPLLRKYSDLIYT